MKIIELHFTNINNLKGEHRISFDQVPLSTASIFAIVGPTGSGKSTILDVITLALFNRIPRFNKAISKNEITKEASVLTHHTKQAQASIEYEIKGLRYKSVWSIATNRNDKLKDYEMTFYNPDGSVADIKKSEVPLKNEEIIGLKYDQFVKAILLSQGEFAKFLKADKNVRGALLENLTGTTIYRKLGSKAYEKFKKVKDILQKEKDLLGENTILNEEQRKQLEEELDAAQKDKSSIDQELLKFTKLLQIKADKNKIYALLATKKNEQLELQKTTQAFQKEQTQLSVHHKLSHLQGPLATYNDAVRNAAQSKKNLSEYKLDVERTNKQLQSTIVEMARITQQQVVQSNFKKVMSAFESEIVKLDNEITHLKQKGEETRTRINNQKTDYLLSLEDRIAPYKAIESLKLRGTVLRKVIEDSKVNTKKSPVELKKIQAKEQEQLDRLRIIENHVETIEGIKLKVAEEHKKLEVYKGIKSSNEPLIQKTLTILETTKNQIELLRKQKEDALKIAELEELRENLQSGEACPLCGSLEHPYTIHLPSNQQNKIVQQIQEAERRVLTHQEELTGYKNKLEKSKTAINITLRTISDAQELLKQEHNTCQKLMSQVGEKVVLDVKQVAQLIQVKTTKFQKEAAAIDAIVEIAQNKNLTAQYEELGVNIVKYLNVRKERNEKYQGSDINAVMNKLQDSFEGHKAEITKLTTVIEKESDSLQRDEHLVESIRKELEPKIVKLGFSNLTEISANLLDESTLQELTQKQDALKERTIRISTEINNYNKELEAREKEDLDPATSLAALEEIINGKNNQAAEFNKLAITNQEKLKRDNEDQEKIKAREKKINELNQEFDKWSLLNQMIGDATGNKFANFAQGLTLKNLLVYANQRLRNLSDRYQLTMPKEEGSLLVIDNYQGDSIRSIKTLSGGETFLISLALALSLSDMASKNVALGCLFIDEGFGTLDSDTLELAMTTLETLQSESQKAVGVISHVEALKERIDVQIKLKMNAQGHSEIEVHG